MPDVFITCAVTGGADVVGITPHIPVTPQQIAESAIEAARAGAAIVHCHVRDPRTGKGVIDAKLFSEVTKRIRDSEVDVVLNLTGGGGGKIAIGENGLQGTPAPGTDFLGPLDRISFIEECRPEICTLDCGSMTFGDANAVYAAPPPYLRRMAAFIKDLKIKPEIEVFDTGHLWQASMLIEEGLIEGDPLIQFCMGIKYGAPQDLPILQAMINRLPKNAIWSAFGLGRYQIPMAAQAALLGGNCRVGLEDNLFLSKGVYAKNEELVERARTVLELLGYNVLGPAEVRRKLNLVKQ